MRRPVDGEDALDRTWGNRRSRRSRQRGRKRSSSLLATLTAAYPTPGELQEILDTLEDANVRLAAVRCEWAKDRGHMCLDAESGGDIDNEPRAFSELDVKQMCDTCAVYWYTSMAIINLGFFIDRPSEDNERLGPVEPATLVSVLHADGGSA